LQTAHHSGSRDRQGLQKGTSVAKRTRGLGHQLGLPAAASIGCSGASSAPNVHPSQARFLRPGRLLECSHRIRCDTPDQEHTMISRLTTFAVVFAVLGTASLGFAAQVQSRIELEKALPTASIVQVIELPRVEVIGHRSR
jgi:hypothetical protein